MIATREQMHHVEHVMGTAVSIDIRPPLPRDETMKEVVAWLHHVDATFSTYRHDSEISRFGRGEVPIADLTAETEDVLLRCVELGEITHGAFDAFAVPAPNGTLVDPSGYVKGWAVERATALLEAGGARNLCINAGGDIAVRGSRGEGRPWRVGIRHPYEPQRQARVIDLTGRLGIATSATYERGAHIIDPRTGEPTATLASVSVIGPDLGIADALATAMFVMGLDGLAWIEEQIGYDAYVITHDETTHWSTGFPAPSPRSPSGQLPPPEGRHPHELHHHQSR